MMLLMHMEGLGLIEKSSRGFSLSAFYKCSRQKVLSTRRNITHSQALQQTFLARLLRNNQSKLLSNYMLII